MPRPLRFPGSTYLRRPPPEGFGIEFQAEEDGTLSAQFAFDPTKEGPPGHAHGGAVATILDEAMGAVGFENERPGFTATMTVNYRISVPLETIITVRARVVRIEGNKTFSAAEIILSDGRVAADSNGLFIFSQLLLDQVKAYYAQQPPTE